MASFRLADAMLAAVFFAVAAPPAAAAPDYGDLYAVGLRAGPSVVQPQLMPVASGFLAGWSADGRVVLRALDENGRPRAPESELTLPFLAALLAHGDGALVLGPDRLIVVDGEGRPRTAEVVLDGAPLGIHRAFANGDGGGLLAVAFARGEDGAYLESALFDSASGHRRAGPFRIELGNAFVVALGLTRLESGGALVAWSEGRSVIVLRLDDSGAPVGAATRVHTMAPGGSLQCCWLAAEGEDARLLWRDSADGDFVLRSLTIGTAGSDGSVVSMDGGAGDALYPSLASGPDGAVVAWIAGLRFGPFSRRGRGAIAIAHADRRGAATRLEAPGSIERVALAVDGRRLAVLALVRERQGADSMHLAARGLSRDD